MQKVAMESSCCSKVNILFFYQSSGGSDSEFLGEMAAFLALNDSSEGWDLAMQGCCLTGARSPEAPKFRVRATKVLFKEFEWKPKHGVFIPI